MNNADDIPLFLGVDGGGSTCRARLTDVQGNILGEGRAGPANFRLGVSRVMEQITAATQLALLQAEIPERPLNTLYAGLGLAGAVLESDQVLAQPVKALFARCRLTDDAYIACLGAHQGQPGGILILGTGSCAQIITPQDSRTYGGWGFAVADQGSGASLGREAVRLALLALETIIPASPLTDAVNAHFGHQVYPCFDWSLTAKPADYARFAPLVFQHARAGDAHAQHLITQACADVSRFIAVLARHDTGRIALLGGLSALYTEHLPTAVQQQLCPPRGDALDGALIMAKDLYKENSCQ